MKANSKKIRLGIRKEHGPLHAALCNCEYDSILKVARQKLQLGKKALQSAKLVVESTGEELSKTETAPPLSDGHVIVVFTQAKNPTKSENDETPTSLPPLPLTNNEHDLLEDCTGRETKTDESPRKVKSPERPSEVTSQPSSEVTLQPSESVSMVATKERLDYICVLDFEANCMKKGLPTPQEIIEFPVILVNVATGEVEDVFHTYVKPDVHPKISLFCTQLTGISRELLQNQGIPLQQALSEHEIWMERHKLIPAWLPKSNKDQRTCLFLTCGDWDFQTCLPQQLAYHGADIPMFARRWINIKPVFMKVYRIYSKKGLGMVRMLEMLKLDLVGRHHSGIDDCRNTARIVQKMIEAGWKPTCQSWTSSS